jgi:NADP-dependent 3-hydroxy acid dehydrogenase YdfG
MIDDSSHSTKSPHCAVVGAGPGNGTAFARKFSKEGYAVALLAWRIERLEALARELPRARALACDVTDPLSIECAFAAIAMLRRQARRISCPHGASALWARSWSPGKSSRG